MSKFKTRETLASLIPNKKMAAAVSGGIDSSAVVVSALDAGADVTAFSFTLSDRWSSDMRAAQRLADKLGIDFVPVYLPTCRAAISRDVKTLIRRYGVRGKTGVECLFPFLYLLKEAQARGFGTLLTGITADNHFALSKKEMIHYRYPKEKFQQRRRECFDNPNPSQVRKLKEIAKGYGVDVLAPFHDRRVFDLYSNYGWDDLNKPRQKEAIRCDYPELESLRIAKHSDLQLGDSGIAKTVGEAAISTFSPGAKSAVKAYNRVARL